VQFYHGKLLVLIDWMIELLVLIDEWTFYVLKLIETFILFVQFNTVFYVKRSENDYGAISK
jgi:hypothetical protein